MKTLLFMRKSLSMFSTLALALTFSTRPALSGQLSRPGLPQAPRVEEEQLPATVCTKAKDCKVSATWNFTALGGATVTAGFATGPGGARSTWLNQVAPGTNYPLVSPLMALAPRGGVGSASWIGSRTSDAGQRPLPTENAFIWDDYNPSQWSTWARYTESDLTSSFTTSLTTVAGSTLATVPVGTQLRQGMPIANDSNIQSGTKVAAASGVSVTLSKEAVGTGTVSATFGKVGYHIGEENSVYSLWTYQFTDPFSINPLGGTRNVRLDCGKGTPFEKFGPPQRCSAALEIVNNDANYGKGIMFGADALDKSEHGLAQAVAMAPMQALVWYYAFNTPGWSIYQDSMSGADGAQYQLHLGNGYAQFNSLIVARGYIGVLSTPASSSSPCTAGQFSDDSNYHYVCVAANTWKRVALSSWP